MRKVLFLFILLILIIEYSNVFSGEKEKSISDISKRLLKAYPDFIISVDSGFAYFKDGTKLALQNKEIQSTFDDTLNKADISEMFSQSYIPGRKYEIPIAVDYDPGRIVNIDFFEKMYGKSKSEVQKSLVSINWLPTKIGEKIKFSKLNGAAQQLQKVSDELDKLPDNFKEYLYPLGGTVTWRTVAGTSRLSMHSLGIAIDICVRKSNYWRYSKPDKLGIYKYKNRIPWEIVDIFEKHGFIWGGKWYHYDTMHFEYRPELIDNGK